MSTLKNATKPPENLSDFQLVPQPSSAARPMPTPDPNSMPNYESLSLAPAPAVMSTDVDRQRQFYRHGVSQYRISPLPSKANPQINASSRGIANKVVQQAIAAIPPVVIPPSVGDGLIHGDAIWESDSAYALIRDDFNGSRQTTDGNIGEIGWTLASSSGGALNASRWNPFTPLGAGTFNISTSNTSSGFANINLVGTLTRDTTYPLFDYPSWKATFVFALAPGDASVPGFAFVQKAIYIGLGANPSSSGSSQWVARPHIFMGLRFDTDTTAPAISDTTFKFEVVANFNAAATTRVNTQGTVVDTGVTPTYGSYRLEIQCLASGVITMSLNGSAPVSFNIPTLTTGTLGFGGETAKVVQGVASLNPDTAGGTLYNANAFTAGSKVTLAGFTSPFTSFNGSQTLAAVGTGGGSSIAEILTNIPDQGNQSNSGTIIGFPAVVPLFSLGNDTQATPQNGAISLLCDFFSLIMNPKVGGGAGTPLATKSRYW